MEQPIPIESDFISHIDGHPCRDLKCPCHAEQITQVNISKDKMLEYDHRNQTLTVYFGGRRMEVLGLAFTREETYRLLVLLSAEMPASHE